RRLKLVWDDSALDDLAECALWSVPQARRVVDAMDRMARIGWSLGRTSPLFGPEFRYWPVPPLGIVYELRGEELHIVRVVDVRRLQSPP
ncbi:MAG: type II toxin-antitoxin system RelE/ParE family toxin, partial [Candidatus Dormibacteraeota bacterium]|nr:type II toxin-antitoxin system RelE/ParE family toxin [Candidatus Dormibacteraeota bacterium]